MPKLAELHHCTACTACAAACPKGCISMEPDPDGFLYPVVEEGKCVGCCLCEKVCPVLNRVELNHVPTACAAKSRDDTSRMASTSGGVFPELARFVLAKGGAVFGAAYDERFRIVHICAENETELDRLRGAKYAQSDLGGSFREVKRRLENGQWVLFSGTPCQVSGLRSFLKQDYENLLLVDLVCHSVPSPLAWEKFLEYISCQKQLAAVNLRCKDTGWSRYGYSNRFDFSDGSCHVVKSDESLYMKLFVGGYITRPACESCRNKGYARVSDLTLGDFWGIWDIMPELDDNRGISAVLVQTEKGRNAIEMVEKKAVTLEEVSRENPAILHAASPNPLREQAMQLIREGDIIAASRLIPAVVPAQKPRLLRQVGRFLKRNLGGQ